jgi:hypothetical protein
VANLALHATGAKRAIAGEVLSSAAEQGRGARDTGHDLIRSFEKSKSGPVINRKQPFSLDRLKNNQS